MKLPVSAAPATAGGRRVARSQMALLALLGALTVVIAAERLPQTAIPDHYDIHLAPDFATDTFAGRVSISVRLAQPVNAITLNAADIQFLETTITTKGGTQAATVSLDPDRETATLTVPGMLPSGPATIAIRYTGQLNDKLRGFYLSQANNREYAITQLEATDARRAFPSFDEPAMKATFAVSTTIDARDTAISNGRVISDTPGPGVGKHTMKFATTKRMSTYLVALLVGDWECVRGGSDGIPIRICGTPNRKNELGFALESAESAMRYFNRYFSIPYPFEKLDIIAVPDFSAGAMENTGAIVFREQLLLVNDSSSTEQRQRTVQYLGHEIAHQWFGDLVTMRWWDDIWLNEGLATWMERRPMREWKPQWNPELDEVRDTQNAMNLDTLRATRPIRTPVDTPDEINQVFDAIAYQKTAAVLRMVEGYVGASSYRDGINAYLKKFAYGNAAGEGLWTTLAAATHKPVDTILSSYVTQGSMPLVSVSTTCTGSTTELSLAQKPISNAVPASTTWNIPVCYKRARNGKVEPAACAVLSGRTQAVKLDGCSSWIFANVDSRGYYRTSYAPEGLRALGEAARDNHLTPVEQTSLLEDVWVLVRLNEEDIAAFLSLATDLVNAPLGPAVVAVTDRINVIADRLVDEPLRPRFERWVRQTLQPVADKLGWVPGAQEGDDRRSIRAAVLYTLGYAGRDPNVLREARRRADVHLAGVAPLDPSLVDAVLQLAAIDGDAPLYDRYLAIIRDQDGRGEQLGYRTALAYFSDPALRRRTLDYATSPQVRTQDAPGIIAALMARPSAAPATWAHVKATWPWIEKSFGVFQGLPQIVGSTQNFCDSQTRNDIEQFFESHPIRGTERAARQALETIDRCILMRNQQLGNLDAWLKAQG
jgi:aminopeptidase N